MVDFSFSLKSLNFFFLYVFIVGDSKGIVISNKWDMKWEIFEV